jgi:hypothetical protein
VVDAAGGRILGVTDGIEPQHGAAFVVELAGWRFSVGAISPTDMQRMGGTGWFSMGEFGAGMSGAGWVKGIRLFGGRRIPHWEWTVHGWVVEVYPVYPPGSTVPPRSIIAMLVIASDRVHPAA